MAVRITRGPSIRGAGSSRWGLGDQFDGVVWPRQYTRGTRAGTGVAGGEGVPGRKRGPAATTAAGEGGAGEGEGESAYSSSTSGIEGEGDPPRMGEVDPS